MARGKGNPCKYGLALPLEDEDRLGSGPSVAIASLKEKLVDCAATSVEGNYASTVAPDIPSWEAHTEDNRGLTPSPRLQIRSDDHGLARVYVDRDRRNLLHTANKADDRAAASATSVRKCHKLNTSKFLAGANQSNGASPSASNAKVESLFIETASCASFSQRTRSLLQPRQVPRSCAERLSTLPGTLRNALQGAPSQRPSSQNMAGMPAEFNMQEFEFLFQYPPSQSYTYGEGIQTLHNPPQPHQYNVAPQTFYNPPQLHAYGGGNQTFHNPSRLQQCTVDPRTLYNPQLQAYGGSIQTLHNHPPLLHQYTVDPQTLYNPPQLQAYGGSIQTLHNHPPQPHQYTVDPQSLFNPPQLPPYGGIPETLYNASHDPAQLHGSAKVPETLSQPPCDSLPLDLDVEILQSLPVQSQLSNVQTSQRPQKRRSEKRKTRPVLCNSEFQICADGTTRHRAFGYVLRPWMKELPSQTVTARVKGFDHQNLQAPSPKDESTGRKRANAKETIDVEETDVDSGSPKRQKRAPMTEGEKSKAQQGYRDKHRMKKYLVQAVGKISSGSFGKKTITKKEWEALLEACDPGSHWLIQSAKGKIEAETTDQLTSDELHALRRMQAPSVRTNSDASSARNTFSDRSSTRNTGSSTGKCEPVNVPHSPRKTASSHDKGEPVNISNNTDKPGNIKHVVSTSPHTTSALHMMKSPYTPIVVPASSQKDTPSNCIPSGLPNANLIECPTASEDPDYDSLFEDSGDEDPGDIGDGFSTSETSKDVDSLDSGVDVDDGGGMPKILGDELQLKLDKLFNHDNDQADSDVPRNAVGADPNGEDWAILEEKAFRSAMEPELLKAQEAEGTEEESDDDGLASAVEEELLKCQGVVEDDGEQVEDEAEPIQLTKQEEEEESEEE